MNHLIKCLFAILCIACAAIAHGSTTTGKIKGWIPYLNGTDEIILIHLDQAITSAPACSTTSRYAIRASDPHFKGTRLAIVSAYLSNDTVTVVGKSTCNAWGNAEDINYICVGTTPC